MGPHLTAADKPVLRAAALAARGAGGDAAALTANLTAALAPHVGRVLAGYWPIRGEADPLSAMAAHNGPVCLPVVVRPGAPLVFRLWRREPLEPGPFGTAHPRDSAPVVRPEVLIVPLVGFDRRLNRLGYGGGFYDRTLHLLRAGGQVTAIGLAFAVQQLDALPAEPTDAPLDLLVTDRGTLSRPV